MKVLNDITLMDVPGADDTLRRELPNGIVVLARTNFHSPSVTVQGYLPVGSIFDDPAKLGLADFTASALMRGTQSYSFQLIYEMLEEVGAGLGFSGGTHTAGFAGRSLVEDLPLLMHLLAEALRRPKFPARQVEKLRAGLLTSLDLRQQDTREIVGLKFDEIVYRNHPYGRPDEGFPETVRRIRQKDLKLFHRHHYGPKGLVLAIVGGIDPQKAVDLVAETLDDWQNPSQPNPPELPVWQPLEARQRVNVPMAGKSQSDLVIGTAGPERSDKHFLAAAVGNMILGKFGMMGRIGEVLREKEGLAYYAYSSLGSSPGPGAWTVASGVHPKEVDNAITLIFRVLQDFVSELVTLEELQDVQDNLIGSLPLSLESNGGVASRLLHIERHQLGLDYLHQYPTLVRSVNREQILEAAAKFLDLKRLAVVTAGPPTPEKEVVNEG
jgi:zinc protease